MSVKIVRTSVHTEKASHAFYQEMTGGPRANALDIPFASMPNAFIALACLGAREDCFTELRDKQEIFIAPSFDSDHIPVLVSLAYDRLVSTGKSHEEAIRIVSSSTGFVPVVEGWAQGGLRIFQDALRSGSPHATEVLIDLVMPAVKSVL